MSLNMEVETVHIRRIQRMSFSIFIDCGGGGSHDTFSLQLVSSTVYCQPSLVTATNVRENGRPSLQLGCFMGPIKSQNNFFLFAIPLRRQSVLFLSISSPLYFFVHSVSPLPLIISHSFNSLVFMFYY
jgi:hypothetical protein